MRHKVKDNERTVTGTAQPKQIRSLHDLCHLQPWETKQLNDKLLIKYGLKDGPQKS